MTFNDLSTEDAKAYWHDEGLAKLCARDDDTGNALAPQMFDLVRLHRLVQQCMSVTALEFGVGYSTLVLADALARNESAYKLLSPTPKLRAAKPFNLFTVDASAKWLQYTSKRLPAALARRVNFIESDVHIGTFNGRVCHFYDQLPDIVPDFIYIDGPDPKDVQGNLRGLTFQAPDRTVMAADVLAMEPVLLPGCTIVCDGRINNARFLANNFQRKFVSRILPGTDITVFHLDEPPLGAHTPDLVAMRAGKNDC